MIPIDDDNNKVLQGRCLHCNPNSNKNPSGHSHNRNPSARSNSNSNKLQRSTTYHPSTARDVTISSSLPARAMSSPPHEKSKAVKSDPTRIDDSGGGGVSARNASAHSLTSIRADSLRTTRSYRSIASAGSLDSCSTVATHRSPAQDSVEKMSKEEIQKAAEVLMTAAHEQGLDGRLAISLQDLVVNLAESSGLSTTVTTTTNTSDDDEDDEDKGGILDRGGAVRCGRLIYAGSTRTLSSMSSIDETDHPVTTYVQFQQALRNAGKSSRTLGSLSTIDGANEEEIISQSALDNKNIRASSTFENRADSNPSSKDLAKALESPASQPEASIPAHKKIHNDELYPEETKCYDTEIESILQSVRDSMDSSSPFQSMKAMESLSGFLALFSDEPYLDLYVEKGLARVLVSVMNKYPESPEILRKACEVLTTLAAAPSSSSSTRLRSIVQDGACEAILFSCMILHEDNPGVQKAALHTMRYLCQDCEENQRNFWMLDAMEPILRSMENHSKAPRLQEIGATVVSMLANNPNAKNAIGEHGGVSVILGAISMHLKDSGVVEACIQALYTLISECPNNILVLLNAPGSTNTILDVMGYHKQILAVQEIGCAMLVKLTTLAEHTDLLLENGGGSMGTGMPKPKNDKSNNELLENVIETVLETIQNHSGVPIVQDFGFTILFNLTDSNETKMFVVDLGALDAIVLAMVLHEDDARVQERICNLLLLLAVQENHQHILATKPIGLVKLAANKYPEECREPASRLIRQLGFEF